MTVGITFSTFDLLHAGHISMLREAKAQCDYLICGLQVDPSVDRSEKNKPVQTLVERWMQLQGVKYVDEIIPYQTEADLEDILKMLDIDIRIIGSEYKNKTFTGRATCSQRGIEVYYNRRDHGFSTSDLRARVYNVQLKKDNK
jgi:glycerol-3-phosphate cytidylyltransferase